MTVELKPCPFCGGEPKAVKITPHGAVTFRAVMCSSCEVRTAPFNDACAPEAWNHRAAPSSTRIATLEAENLRLQNEWDNCDEMLQACRSKIETLEAALRGLLSLAEKQKAYHNAKQHKFPSIEQCVDEDGIFRPDLNLYALLQGEAANGRYSEADWWLCTIRAEIAALASQPDTPVDVASDPICRQCASGEPGIPDACSCELRSPPVDVAEESARIADKYAEIPGNLHARTQARQIANDIRARFGKGRT